MADTVEKVGWLQKRAICALRSKVGSNKIKRLDFRRGLKSSRKGGSRRARRLFQQYRWLGDIGSVNGYALMMELAARVVGAFPSAMRERARGAAGALAATEAKLLPTSFSVIVDGEQLDIPERLYVAAPTNFNDLDSVIAALMTRHHDGFVREKAVQRLLSETGEWPIPFLIRLIGEYVVEIIDHIDDAFDALDRDAWTAFVVANPSFVALTDARVVSYWNCYYRQVSKADYGGFRLMNKVRKLTQV